MARPLAAASVQCPMPGTQQPATCGRYLCTLQAGMWIDHIVMIGSIPKDRLAELTNVWRAPVFGHGQDTIKTKELATCVDHVLEKMAF
uniref:Uncharacterized protein n=1 Tax=Oryza glumipatula TaxID=40148 RepID=A0A0D9Y6A0_9ORYZ